MNAQLDAELASRARQAGQMIRYRLHRGVTDLPPLDMAIVRCEDGACSRDRHRDLVFLLVLCCMLLTADISDSGNAYAAIAVHGSGPDETAALLAAEELLRPTLRGAIGLIATMEADGLRYATGGLVECAVGLLVYQHDTGPAAAAQIDQLVTDVLRGLASPLVPDHITGRPWLTAPVSS